MKIILAVSDDNVIGIKDYDGALKLPWHLPADLAHFSRVTMGQTVVMGRKTWESLPPGYRPLKGRTNLVLTSDPCRSFEGARALSFEELLANYQDAWVIGGREIYDLVAPYVDLAVVTRVHLRVVNDNEHRVVYGPNLAYLPNVVRGRPLQCPIMGTRYTIERLSRQSPG